MQQGIPSNGVYEPGCLRVTMKADGVLIVEKELGECQIVREVRNCEHRGGVLSHVVGNLIFSLLSRWEIQRAVSDCACYVAVKIYGVEHGVSGCRPHAPTCTH